tara:strand:- start:323 stop:619 length:297 start_codon:yes stop_codon:yes gene_type:complete
MKEIEVNKTINEYIIPLLINDGELLIELGYRTLEGKWIELSSTNLKLSNRNPRKQFLDDNWFYQSPSSSIIPKSLHERMYKLSEKKIIGGSEKVNSRI